MNCYGKVLLVAAVCLLGCRASPAVASNREVMVETMPLYTVLNNLNLLNSTQCRAEMQQLRDAIDANVFWAMRLLDVSGSPGAGFTIGNNFWPGSRLGCDYINDKRMLPLSTRYKKNASIYRDPETEFPPFKVQYYVARFLHNSTWQYHIGIHGEERMVLGLCLPSTCTANELRLIIEKIFRDRTLLIGQLYRADFMLVKVSDVTNDYQWLLSGPKMLIIFVLLLSIGLVVFATVYDVMVYQKRLLKKRDFLTFENNNTADLKNDVEAKHEPETENISLEEHKPQSMKEKLLICFSAYSNAKQIFNLETGRDSVPALHGIKFLSMSWIIFVHAAYFSNNYMANTSLGVMYTDELFLQIISNATYSVDTFLCISGFLISFMFMKVMRKEKPVLNPGLCALQISLQTVKRFIRLTPTYLTVILLAILNYDYYSKTSSYQIYEEPSYYCSKYWWRNLLYINNFYSWDELCLSWSWYVANDMQFFVFATILLMLYIWRSYVALALGSLTLLVCIVTNGYTAYALDYVPSVDAVHRTLTELYIRPWLRIGPFLIGIAAALIIDKLNYKVQLSTRDRTIGWTLSILCNCGILFTGVQRDLPIYGSVIYTSLSRTFWGIGIAWLTFACVTNNGGIVNKILSFKLFIPLSRLTFCAYLANPFIISSMNLNNKYPHYFDILSTGNMAIGMIVITYICSTVLSLIAEAPAINLLRVLSNQKMRK
ncbi:nose resistant to fluoxetine protein 6 [Megalopta genalis]|uniref:nose resistant to fluoxetine protein 6 n=1 Tax=Megalopta genalis TaxID=115081 RepID=UPI003FD3D0AD